MFYQLTEHIDGMDPVSGTVVNVINGVLADTVGPMITVTRPVTVGTGGGCSAAIANVLFSVDGEGPGLAGQLVMWEGQFGDVAPTDAWLELAVGWYPVGRLYDAGPDADTLGDADPLVMWNGESAPECLADMVNGAESVIDIIAATIGIVPTRY